MRILAIAVLAVFALCLLDEALFYGSHVDAVATMLRSMRRGFGW
jgi:hypothetical protein